MNGSATNTTSKVLETTPKWDGVILILVAILLFSILINVRVIWVVLVPLKHIRKQSTSCLLVAHLAGVCLLIGITSFFSSGTFSKLVDITGYYCQTRSFAKCICKSNIS